MNTTNDGGVIRTLVKSIPIQEHGIKAGIVLCLVVAAFFFGSKQKGRSSAAELKVPTAKLNKNRKLGSWIPDYEFQTPIPSPYKDWDVKKTKPLPYRAFKHNYTVNMGIRNMDFENWIELDNEWEKFHNYKLDRIKTKGTELYETSPEARNAAFELLDELWQYLPNRYPTLFKQHDYGLENLVTGEILLFKEGFRTDEDPILTASKMIQDDLAIMIEDEKGTYYLKAGAILLAGFWRFRDKYQMPLSMIHTSGDVPQYNEKLHTGMAKFFIRQTCDKPVVRNNHFIQTDDNLPRSYSIGPEEKSDIGWYSAEEAASAEQLFFRSERQSLRRLPKSGAIVFTIRTYFLPLTEMCKEKHVPRRLLNGMTSWGDDVKEYKGWDKYKAVIIPYLEKVAAEQEAEGIHREQEKAAYPF